MYKDPFNDSFLYFFLEIGQFKRYMIWHLIYKNYIWVAAKVKKMFDALDLSAAGEMITYLGKQEYDDMLVLLALINHCGHLPLQPNGCDN